MTTTSQIITDNKAYAATWANRVETFLSALQSLSNTRIGIDQPPDAQLLNFDGVSNALNVVLGHAPAAPNISIPQENPPAAPIIDIPAIEDIAIPDFHMAPPAITLPAAPALDLPARPGAAPGVRDVVLPEAPTIEIPTAPTLAAINLPGPIEVELPSFDLAPPAIDIDAPTGTFLFAEQAYESDGLDALGATLTDDLTSGGYGIDTADEIRVWGRAVDREEAQRRQAVDEASRAFVSRRFSRSPGSLFDAIDGATQRAADGVSEVNREIAVKRTTDYIQARQFTITAATQFEQILITHHAGIMERALNASRYLVEYGIQGYNAKVAELQLRLDSYRTGAQVFETRLKAAVQAIEVHRAQLESARVRGEIQKIELDKYQASIQALNTIVELYRSRMQAASVQADVERLRLDAHRSEVESYSATVQAQVARLNAHEAAVRGEEAKARIFESQVKAYEATVDAVRAKAEVKRTMLTAHTERARSRIDVHNAELQGWRARLEADVQRAGIKSDVYRSQIAAFSAKGTVASEIARLGISNYEASAQAYAAFLNHAVQKAQVQLEQAKAILGVRASAAEAGADFYSNIVSGALNTISALASQTTED
ncbi:MAG: hypothetical protein ACREXW_00920 [Gammaproteobacteria bacterium]